MRKGVIDLWRTYQVGIAANHRYLDALTAAPLKGEGVAALGALCRPRTNCRHRYARFSHLNPADLACSEQPWVVSTPSEGSATPTSPTAVLTPTRRPRGGQATMRTKLTPHRQAPTLLDRTPA
jgi:hypothetical protein